MAEQVNLRIARQGWDAWNAHDVEGWLKILDEKHVWETDTLPAPVNGRDAAGQTMRMYITAFPDLRFLVDQLLPSGDYVMTRYTATGTHRGDLMGIPPTNRRAETHGHHRGDQKRQDRPYPGLLGHRASSPATRRLARLIVSGGTCERR